MDYNVNEKLNYILEFLDYSITQFVDEVIADSETEPEFSAVTLSNIIISYNSLLKIVKFDSFKSLYEFFLTHGYSENDFRKFEQKREKESAYYTGKQYKDFKDK